MVNINLTNTTPLSIEIASRLWSSTVDDKITKMIISQIRIFCDYYYKYYIIQPALPATANRRQLFIVIEPLAAN